MKARLPRGAEPGRSRGDLDDVRRRRHPARPRRVPDGADQRQGRRLPVRRRHRRDHRAHVLLELRLAGPDHEADRRRRGDAQPDLGRRYRGRQLREPGPGPAVLPHERDALHRGSAADRWARQGRHRLRLDRQQPHRRCRRPGHPPDDREPQEAWAEVLGRRQEPGRCPEAGDPQGRWHDRCDPRLRRDRQGIFRRAVGDGQLAALAQARDQPTSSAPGPPVRIS